jgi:hypothetical protein
MAAHGGNLRIGKAPNLKRRVLAAVAVAALASAGSAATSALVTTTVPPLADVNFYDSSVSTPYDSATGAAVIGNSTDQWNNIRV